MTTYARSDMDATRRPSTPNNSVHRKEPGIAPGSSHLYSFLHHSQNLSHRGTFNDHGVETSRNHIGAFSVLTAIPIDRQ